MTNSHKSFTVNNLGTNYLLSDTDNPHGLTGLWAIRPTLPWWFMRHISHQPNGCWNWTGWIAKNIYYPVHGYGCLKYFDADGKRRTTTAHRYAYSIVRGPISSDLDIDHLCQNKLCVNPSHLEAITHQQNCARRLRSGAIPRRSR